MLAAVLSVPFLEKSADEYEQNRGIERIGRRSAEQREYLRNVRELRLRAVFGEQ